MRNLNIYKLDLFMFLYLQDGCSIYIRRSYIYFELPHAVEGKSARPESELEMFFPLFLQTV